MHVIKSNKMFSIEYSWVSKIDLLSSESHYLIILQINKYVRDVMILEQIFTFQSQNK